MKLPKKKKINSIVESLVDRNYGEDKDDLVTTSITLPRSLKKKLEIMAFENKHAGKELNTVTKIVRCALNEYFVK